VVSLRIKDTDGLWSETRSENFLVNAPPTSIIDSIKSNIYHRENPRYVTLDLFGRGFDDVGVSRCEWQMDYLDNQIHNLNIMPVILEVSPACSSKGVGNLTPGNYSISLRVEDNLGVWGEWFVYPDYYVDDGDNYTYQTDVYPLDNTQWYDRDRDGCGDNEDGTNGDAFPNDPTECIDTDGDGVGDNSDFLPEIPNMYAYGAIGSMVALIGAGLAEFAARRSLTGVLEGLEALNSMGVSDSEINKAIESLTNSGGLQFFSSDLSEAKELLGNYTEITGNANQSMLELQQLKDELAEMEAQGMSSPELANDISEIEEMINTEVTTETNSDYLESLKKEK